MYPADSLHDNLLTRIAFYEDDYYYTDSIITLNVYSGGDTNPETLIGTETTTINGTDGWREVFLSTPIEFNPAQNLWITLTATGLSGIMYMSGQDAGVNGRWFLNGSDWVDLGTLYYLDSETKCFAIRGFVETNDNSTWNWATESGITSPFTITGLEAETDYAVRVKSNRGQDCESGWTWAYFTTPSACDRPFDLEATNITSNSATLNWTGYQDSYNLKYRHRVDDPNTPATIILEAHNVWGNGTGYQMLLDADATAFGTIFSTYNHLTYSCTIPEGLYDAFEYMIPANADASCDPEYFVLDTIISIEIPAGTYDWCITHPIPGEWITIADNNGNITGRYDNYVFEPGVTYHFTMGYWPLYNQDYVTLEIIQDWSDWTVVENITHPYSFTGLIPEAEYEWQVQGINADCEGGLTAWSEIATFTTPDMSVSTQTVELVEGNNWFSSHVEITLDDLKGALVEALPGSTIIITSQSSGSATYNGTRWRGNLTTMDVAQMYKITVTADCEITLAGMPVNPAGHPVAILNGANWIAFPLSEPMTLSDAFVGFAVSGDMVTGQSGTATYNGTRWRGVISTLEPGQGYVYTSGVAGNRTLTFPASAK